jgi:hypothetical protein
MTLYRMPQGAMDSAAQERQVYDRQNFGNSAKTDPAMALDWTIVGTVCSDRRPPV